MGMIIATDVTWGWIIMHTLGLMAVAFAIGTVLYLACMLVFRTAFNRARNNPLARDYGRLTQFKANSLSEKQARRIYGDPEVDRFLQYGDYDPPQQIHPFNERH